MTRRSLLGAAVVVGAAGLVDLFRRPGASRAAVSSGGGSRLPVHDHGTGRHNDHGHSAAGAPARNTGRPPHHGNGDAPPPKHDHQHHGGHHRNGHGHHDRAAEHVDLPPPRVRVRERPVYDVKELIPDPPKHAIALTVDDGPDPDWTPKVLRLLDKYRMQASFCVIGMQADRYPKLVRDVHRAGHVIVNHSYTHIQPFNRQTEKRIVAEITRCQRAIEKATKITPDLFRAPGGDWSPFIFRAVAAYGLTPLDWDVDPRDWAMPGTRKIEHAMLKGRPGDIVLCHDGGGNRNETVKALRKVLPTWKHRGYTTIPLVVPSHHHTTKHGGGGASPSPSPSTSTSPSTSPSDSPSS
jgi:peptidoglycan/xylan/chitin deacetylase (PgdA/CDA1 family)